MWLVVMVLILGFVVGPIMWVLPSKRDKRIAKLRNYAAQEGVRVRLVARSSLPGISEAEGSSVNLVRYSINWDSESDDAETASSSKVVNLPWRLQVGRIEHEAHFSGNWEWAKDLIAGQKWHRSLREILTALPDDVHVIENTPYDLAIFWQEKGSNSEVDRLVEILKTLRNLG